MRSEKMGKTAVTQGNGVRAELPSSVRRILIVGAGGFGREVLQWARAAWPVRAESIAGFLSADERILDGHARSLPILGTPDNFTPANGDALLLAIGISGVRRRVAESLASRGATFLTLIHPSAIVTETASIGAGSIVCPYTIVSDGASIGRFTLLNYFASLGHDARTGEFCVLSPYATLGGAACLGDDVFLGMHASVGPIISVGCRSKVSANTAALVNVPNDSLVFGSPSRFAPLISPSSAP
jgi:sugar O-acyltransferase (sialic acid O-acetyltransferase NeuD family)